MDKILSVIIPMYNVEKYIEKCLESFNIEEIRGDIEVLVIDDGSKDGSSIIAREYENRYPDTYRVVVKENGGHGSTINRGIEEARGIYFKPVDGDDYVDKKGLIRLVNLLKDNDADLVFTNYMWVDDKTGRKKHEVDHLSKGIEYEKVYDIGKLKDIFLKMHAMTYRTQLLKDMPDRLDEHCFYVDTEYMLYPLPYIKHFIVTDFDVYMYRIGLNSQSMNPNIMAQRSSQHEYVLEQLLRFYDRCKKMNVNNKVVETIAKSIGRVATSQYKIYLRVGNDKKNDMIILDERLSDNYPEIYSAMDNKAIAILRKSDFVLYTIASKVVKIANK